MPQTLGILQSEYSVDGATWREQGGLFCLDVRTDQCEARVFPQGGTVAAWTPAGQRPGLHLSPKAVFAPGKAIRGGIPLCFPWFGPRHNDPKPGGKPSGQHGFARSMVWHVEGVFLDENGKVGIEMKLEANEATYEQWNAAFEATLTATLGQTCNVQLQVTNTGAHEIEFEVALHSYLEVGDVTKVQVLGLDGVKYIDKVDGLKEKLNEGPFMLTDETDRVFMGTKSPVIVVDPVLNRHLKIEKGGSNTTVVWNPWLVKAQTIPDIGGEAWKSFICVEAANARPHQVPLPAGAVHTTSTRISVIPQAQR